MERRLKYFELKTGYSDDGPSWIGYAEFSKSGNTIYFNNKAIKGNGHGGASDIETGDIYWVSGIKKTEPTGMYLAKAKFKLTRQLLVNT